MTKHEDYPNFDPFSSDVNIRTDFVVSLPAMAARHVEEFQVCVLEQLWYFRK